MHQLDLRLSLLLSSALERRYHNTPSAIWGRHVRSTQISFMRKSATNVHSLLVDCHEVSFVMEPEKKEQREKPCFLEILRCLFYVVVIVFFLSWMSFLLYDYLQMKRRLAAIDEKMKKFELTPKKPLPSSPPHTASRAVGLDAEDLHVRLRRTVTISLQSLEKRLKVLEAR